MARWTASAKWAGGPALDGQRDMPLALRLSEGLGVTDAMEIFEVRLRHNLSSASIPLNEVMCLNNHRHAWIVKCIYTRNNNVKDFCRAVDA